MAFYLLPDYVTSQVSIDTIETQGSCLRYPRVVRDEEGANEGVD